ncbi:MAG: SIS domain-containing protein [Bacteroidetes bacterium]|nr:SIS domain-containing protein [Bacteroidota bacterium]
MLLNTYKEKFTEFLNSKVIDDQIQESVKMIKQHKRIFFIGNGGSNSICSHLMEDFAKVLKYESFAFTDPALITCFSNDYGYEKAMVEWLKVYYKKDDLLVAISSSGNSANINNAVDFANTVNKNVITLSGFKNDNKLVSKGKINFYLNSESYGIVECYHQTILHTILDIINEEHK